MAAEIIEQFPEKEVTIVHSHLHLMHRCSPSAVNYVEKFFLDRGVRLVLGQKVVSYEGEHEIAVH